MRVAIGGSSGLLGSRLTEALRARGDDVVRLVRRPPTAPDERRWDPTGSGPDDAGDRSTYGPGIDAPGVQDPGLSDVDAVVNLAGASIAGWRWSHKYKGQILRSRIDSTATIVDALRLASANGKLRCKTFLSASAIGFYGYDRGDEVLTEKSTPGHGFLAQVCKGWESAANPATDLGVRVVHLRTANVLDPGGGIVKALRLPFLAGLGGRIGSGEQWFSWITSEDHVRAMLFLLDGAISGPVNLAAPDPVRNMQFVEDFARSLNRPAVIPLPTALLGVALTPQMVRETIAAGQRVVPETLEDGGFTFDHPTLTDALRLLGADQTT